MLKRFIDRQLSFIFGHSESSLRRHLETSLERPVSLVLTDNSTSMLSARIKDGVVCIRLHRMFLDAGHEVIEEIVSMLRHRKREMRHFRRFIRDNKEQLGDRPGRKVSLKTLGKYHDLRELYDEINAEYFDGGIKAAITWGSGSSRYAVRKRTLGSYSANSGIIRINPILDKKPVPRYFVAFVVYHEMLHAAMGTVRKDGRRIIHSREFKKREQLFRDYDRAVAWEKRATA